MALSNMRTIDGSRVTQHITPITTPFAMTIPKSLPKVKVIQHRAANPAIVVTELPTMDLKVFEIACPMALFLSPGKRSLFSS